MAHHTNCVSASFLVGELHSLLQLISPPAPLLPRPPATAGVGTLTPFPQSQAHSQWTVPPTSFEEEQVSTCQCLPAMPSSQVLSQPHVLDLSPPFPSVPGELFLEASLTSICLGTTNEAEHTEPSLLWHLQTRRLISDKTSLNLGIQGIRKASFSPFSITAYLHCADDYIKSSSPVCFWVGESI